MPDFVAPLQIVVEGETDAVVVTRLLQGTGIILDSIKVAGGKSKILEKLRGYNQSARFGGNWLVIMDLDQDADCAGILAPDPAGRVWRPGETGWP